MASEPPPARTAMQNIRLAGLRQGHKGHFATGRGVKGGGAGQWGPNDGSSSESRLTKWGRGDIDRFRLPEKWRSLIAELQGGRAGSPASTSSAHAVGGRALIPSTCRSTLNTQQKR